MKRWIKIVTSTTATLIPIGFVCAFATTWNGNLPIFCAGSSGVKPFIEKLGYVYSQEVNHQVDVTVEAGGSGYGISAVADNLTNIGTASKDPYNTVNPAFPSDTSHLAQWSELDIKTVTVAWEAICIVWIPPKGVKPENVHMNIGVDNITKFYESFTGHYGDKVNKQPLLSDFLVFEDGTTNKSSYDISMVPYARSGGAQTSGTAGAFYSDSHNPNALDGMKDNQLAALKTGNYGNNFRVIETDEANSRAWDMFEKNNIPGSVVYLSSGFVEANMDLIVKKGYQIAYYNDVEYSVDKVGGAYQWFRPINIMLSIVKSEQYIKDFVQWMVNPSNEEIRTIISNELGGAPLTPSQFDTMCEGGKFDTNWENFWVSDVDLKKDYYGANSDVIIPNLEKVKN